MQAGFREKISSAFPGILTVLLDKCLPAQSLEFLDTWDQGVGLSWRVCSDQVSQLRPQHHGWQRCQREDRRWLLLTKGLTIPTSIAKQRKFILSSPTFSRFFFPPLECPTSYHQAPGALRLPPSWPEAFYLLFSSISSRSTLPKVHKNAVPSPCCIGDLK